MYLGSQSVCHPSDTISSAYRPVHGYLQESENCWFKCWVQRELQALMQEDGVDIIVQHVVGILDSFRKKRGKVVLTLKQLANGSDFDWSLISASVKPFVFEHSLKFAEELQKFLSSGLTIAAYDESTAFNSDFQSNNTQEMLECTIGNTHCEVYQNSMEAPANEGSQQLGKEKEDTTEKNKYRQQLVKGKEDTTEKNKRHGRGREKSRGRDRSKGRSSSSSSSSDSRYRRGRKKRKCESKRCKSEGKSSRKRRVRKKRHRDKHKKGKTESTFETRSSSSGSDSNNNDDGVQKSKHRRHGRKRKSDVLSEFPEECRKPIDVITSEHGEDLGRKSESTLQTLGTESPLNLACQGRGKSTIHTNDGTDRLGVKGTQRDTTVDTGHAYLGLQDHVVNVKQLDDTALKAQLLEVELRQKALANLMKHLSDPKRDDHSHTEPVCSAKANEVKQYDGSIPNHSKPHGNSSGTSKQPTSQKSIKLGISSQKDFGVGLCKDSMVKLGHDREASGHSCTRSKAKNAIAPGHRSPGSEVKNTISMMAPPLESHANKHDRDSSVSKKENDEIAENLKAEAGAPSTEDEHCKTGKYQEKTMSVMRGGELVQVSYKVYIPQRASKDSKSKLKRGD